MSKRDYYEILGLSRDADDKAIKAAYRKLAMEHHPDRNGGDRSHEKQLAKVIEAYTQLKESPDFR